MLSIMATILSEKLCLHLFDEFPLVVGATGHIWVLAPVGLLLHCFFFGGISERPAL